MPLLRPVLAACLAAALTACSAPAQPSSPTSSPAAAPATGTMAGAPDPAAIFAAYKTDAFVKVNTGPIKSGPHQGDVDLYVDKANADKFKSVGAAAPDGMTVVKVSVQEPQRMYLMKKVAGYDPSNNDWYYANTSSDGKLGMTGKPQMCISCHAGYKSTDYLGSPALVAAKALLK